MVEVAWGGEEEVFADGGWGVEDVEECGGDEAHKMWHGRGISDGWMV